MRATATITSKGQITVPLAVRTRLGLAAGDRVEFVTEGGQTIIKPARKEGNPFKQFAGALGTFPNGLEEINTWVAQLRDDGDDNGS